MTSVPRSEPSEGAIRDQCGLLCHDVTLPELLDAGAAADLFLAPGRCVVLMALPDIQWTPEGLKTFAYRVAGRVPTVLDALPEPLAQALSDAILEVLDWAHAA